MPPESPTIDAASPKAASQRTRVHTGARLLARFEVRQRLGRGSMGQVFLAFDERRQVEVALKVLGELTPHTIAELKSEFRSASELVHPNLVRLHELFCDDPEWFFTMDLLAGETLPELLERRCDLPTDALREIFRQLAHALTALHEAGSLHRDLKPSNFLITDGGQRVVLLDFGLAYPIGKAADGAFAGTPAYMAPEQCWGGQLSEAADWYAFGVVLYEALTGRLPQRMPQKELLERAPPDLSELCLALLNLDPARRPGPREVLERLDPDAPLVERPPAKSTRLLGREDELAALEAALTRSLDGRPALVLVEGPSGIGKTALVEHFLIQAGERGVSCLAGRCRERESMSYKAVDGLVDELVQVLSELTEQRLEELLPAGTSDLTLLFPALRSVPTIARLPHELGTSGDKALLRLRAIEAFRELLTRLGQRSPLILWIDDLQWSDAESSLLLEPVLKGVPPTPLLLLGCIRAETRGASHPSAGPLLDALYSGDSSALPEIQRLRLEPLGAEHATALARAVLPEATNVEDELASSIAREAGGHPLFVQELAHARSTRSSDATTLPELLEARVQSLLPPARELLELTALAGMPVSRPVLRRVHGLSPSRTEELLDTLRASRLLRTAGLGDEAPIDVYHDRVREIVSEGLSPERRRAMHLELARGLEQEPKTKPEELARHFEAADERESATRYWLLAAERASSALAFDHAAQLYERALALRSSDPVSTHTLQIKRAEALANGGKGPAAAAIFLALADETTTSAQLELRRRAAEQLLLAGHLERGLALIDAITQSLGATPTRSSRRALVRAAFGRLRVRLRGYRHQPRPDHEISASDRVHLDVAWTASCALSLIDPIQAARFHNEHLLLALRSGSSSHLLRALALETSYVATPGRQKASQTDELLAHLSDLMQRTDDVNGRGLFELARGIVAYLCGDVAEALARCQTALDHFQLRCPGAVWETLSTQRFVIASSFFLGRFGALSELVPPLVASTEGRGNRYATMCFRSAYGIVAWLTRDDVTEAQQQLLRARRECLEGHFHLSHYNVLLGETLLDLYRGAFGQAHERLVRIWPELERSQLLRIGVIRTAAWELWAGSACGSAGLMLSLGEQSSAERLLRHAQQRVRHLRRDPIPRAAATADLLEAAIADVRGDEIRAIGLLESALERFESLGSRMSAAAARVRLGRLLGSAAGETQVRAGLQQIGLEGVCDPERMVSMLAPGFRPRP